MPKPRLIAWSRACALPTLLLASVVVTAAVTSSCSSTRACKSDTLLVTITLDSAAAMADKLAIAVTVGSAAPKMTTLDHTPGQASGTVEVDFPNGYPKGQQVHVAVTATHAGAPVGTGSADSTLSDGCETVSVSVSGGGGGVGGGGGNGTGGAGGVATGGSDGGPGTGGVGGGTADAGAGGKIDGGPGVGGNIGADAGSDANKADAGCTAPSNTMCGGCFNTTIDRAHCGTSCVACGTAQVCSNSLCVNAVAPTFATQPADPTGWVDTTGAALVITVGSTGYTGAIYECRTGPDASFTSTTPPAWGPCDGSSGAGLRHVPAPNPATPEGNYRTEFRYRSDTYTSAVIATRYYVHHSLDKVGLCPRAGMTSDGPHFADLDYFAAAAAFNSASAANAALFPLTGTFPAGSAIPVRTDVIYLRNPFIKIPFTGVSETIGMSAGTPTAPAALQWPTAGGTYVFNERSLRHAWVINGGRTMILLKRRYVHPAGDCRERFAVGQDRKGAPYLKHFIDCEAMVLNTHGNGLCFNGPGSAPVPVALDAPANGAGTVTATLNSATVTGVGTAFTASLVSEFIQIPSVTGRWYKIATVASATSMTISPVFANTTASGNAYRITLAPTYNIPAAYAKMHPDAHFYATGAIAPFTPSPKTKCETAGCNTNKPWLTYLPP